MKAKNLLLIGIMGFWTVAVNAQTVYVAGCEKTEKGVMLKVWKDGIELYTFTDGTGYANVYDIFVDGSDVYVSGSQQNSTGKYIGKVWKNGNEYFSFDSGSRDSYAKSVCVSGGNVYIAGYENTGTGKNAKVWKNNVVLHNLSFDSDASLSTMYISGNDIYICGGEKDVYGRHIATVWKNGDYLFSFSPTSTSGTYWSDAFDMIVAGNSVYVSGFSGITYEALIHKYTGNSITNTWGYYGTGRINPYAYVYSMDIVGDNPYNNDVYAVVTSSTDKVYKNSSELYSFKDAKIKDISVKEGYVYLTGYESDVAKVWKNGEELYALTDGTVFAEGKVMFVVPSSSTGINELKNGNVAISYSSETNVATINGLKSNEMLYFYSIDGRLLFSHKATGEIENIAVSHLRAGVYLVKLSSGQTLKWVKK